jgi:hypothetical protein
MSGEIKTFNKMVAAVAREMSQRGEVADLPLAKNTAKLIVLDGAKRELFDVLDMVIRSGDADLIDEVCVKFEPALQLFERDIEETIAARMLLLVGDDRIAHERRLADHRAARGVRKVRGAK